MNIRLTIRPKIQSRLIELTRYFWEVADEEQYFLHASSQHSWNQRRYPGKKNTFEKNSRNGWQTRKHPQPQNHRKCQELPNIHGFMTSNSMNGIKAKGWIKKQQKVNLDLKNSRLKLLGQPHYELLIESNHKHKHYNLSEDRFKVRYGFLYKK